MINKLPKVKKEKLTQWYEGKLKNLDKTQMLTNFITQFFVGLAVMIIKYLIFGI